MQPNFSELMGRGETGAAPWKTEDTWARKKDILGEKKKSDEMGQLDTR